MDTEKNKEGADFFADAEGETTEEKEVPGEVAKVINLADERAKRHVRKIIDEVAVQGCIVIDLPPVPTT